MDIKIFKRLFFINSLFLIYVCIYQKNYAYNLNMGFVFKKNIIVIELMVSFFAVLILLINLFCPYLYKKHIINSSRKNGLDVSLVASIIYVESRYNKNAKSNKNAVGLMQLLPQTAEFVCKLENVVYNEEMLYDPRINIEIGCLYLKYLFNKYIDIVTVLACYNAGEGNVIKWKGDNMFLEKTQIVFNETKKYVDKVQFIRCLYNKYIF